MCGRFVGFRKMEELKRYFPIDKDESKGAGVVNYNIAPTQEVLAIAQLNESKILDKYHWGLVPSWAKAKTIGYKMINARAETVATKPSFKGAFKRRRCLIPADGFYEWKGKKGDKQPMFITLSDKSPFVFAGLWENWHDKQNPNENYRSCTIITREAVGAIKALHHRMPVILHPEVYEPWLDPENHDQDALRMLIQTKAFTHGRSHLNKWRCLPISRSSMKPKTYLT